jgi:hypothetical protein
MPSTSPIWTCSRTGAAAFLLLPVGCIAETALPSIANMRETGIALVRPGILRMDGNCVRLETMRGRYLVVWPHGASVDYSATPPVVTDGEGASARIGERVTLEGAHYRSRELTMSRKTAGIIRRCGGQIFVTYGISRPA